MIVLEKIWNLMLRSDIRQLCARLDTLQRRLDTQPTKERNPS